MKVMANIVIMTNNFETQKTYVLSLDKERIEFPRMEIDNENKKDVLLALCDYLRENYIIGRDLDFMPKLVSLHCPFMEKEADVLEMLYGMVVDQELQRDEKNTHWIECNSSFDDPNIAVVYEVAGGL